MRAKAGAARWLRVAPRGAWLGNGPLARPGDGPDRVKTGLYAAFDVQAFYRQHMKQATIWATITDTTPGTVAALLTDPRTDNDTFGNLPYAAI